MPPQPAAVVTRLRAQEGVAMPWKNGGGTTTELAIRPLGSGLGGSFDWRLSVATIDGDGPFSVMAGYERTIAALAGPALTLAHTGNGGEHSRALAAGGAWLFPGEVATSSVKADAAAAKDFNVMIRRDAGAAHVWDLRRTSPTSRWHASTNADVIAFYAADGSAQVAVGAETDSLDPGDLWIWESAARERTELSVAPHGAGPTRVLVVEIALSARGRSR